MLQIDDSIVSFDLMDKFFVCNLKCCKGACCIHGDSGAPLEDDELHILETIYEKVKLYMRAEGIDEVEKNGLYYTDQDGDKVTALINGQECAFTYFDNEMCKCAIEKAYYEGEVEFKKPISCHLYPVRITKYKNYNAVNYDKWDICKAARELGYSEKLSVYKFLKEPLIRRFGELWYEELTLAHEAIIREQKGNKNM